MGNPDDEGRGGSLWWFPFILCCLLAFSIILSVGGWRP
jgi:hypothetical protein